MTFETWVAGSALTFAALWAIFLTAKKRDYGTSKVKEDQGTIFLKRGLLKNIRR